MKKLIMGFLLSVCLMGQAVAEIDPQSLVKQTSEKILSQLKAEQALLNEEPGRIYELVDEVLLPHFDFEYMSQMVLAKYWRRASQEERVAFTAEFRNLLVRTYAKSLNQYVDQEILFLPFRAGRDEKQATVKTEVEQPGSFPIPIDYRLHYKNESWLLFDVLIDGVSLVTNYRSSFAKAIRQEGIQSLIDSLAKKNQQAQG